MVNVSQRVQIIKALLLGCFLLTPACKIIPIQHSSNITSEIPKQFVFRGEIVSNKSLFWKQSFPSEYLQNDIQILFEENFELRAARARVEQANAVYSTARSTLIPSLDAKTSFDRSRIKDNSGTTTKNTIDIELPLHWEPDIWGKLRARKKAAFLSIEEQKALADQTALDLQTMLVESWITHHAACKLEQVLLEQQKANKQFLDLTELRLAQGHGNALDVLQQRRNVVTIERTLPTVLLKKYSAANAYAVLMGYPPDGRSLPEDELPDLEKLSSITTPYQLMTNRPDLRAVFLALQAADCQVAAAIADRLPNLTIELSYGASGNTLSKVGNESVLSIVSGLLTPVFDAGYLKAKANQRKAEVQESLAILEQAVLSAICEVEDTLIHEQLLFDKQKLLQKEINIANDILTKARLRYVNGQESYLTVLLALIELQTLQQNEIEIQKDILVNRSHLLKAIGAKWSQQNGTN